MSSTSGRERASSASPARNWAPRRVLCVDNDELATKIAQENVLINRVEDRVTVADRDIATLTEPFPLIVANLTAKILIELYPHLTRLVSPGGHLVISGIIEQNKPDIEARFLDRFLSLQRLITEQEWVCYVLKKEEQRPMSIPRLYLPHSIEIGRRLCRNGGTGQVHKDRSPDAGG